MTQIDFSQGETKIKKANQMNDKESLIVLDVFNLETNKFFFRIFTKDGKELNYTICDKGDIIKFFLIIKTKLSIV